VPSDFRNESLAQVYALRQTSLVIRLVGMIITDGPSDVPLLSDRDDAHIYSFNRRDLYVDRTCTNCFGGHLVNYKEGAILLITKTQSLPKMIQTYTLYESLSIDD
jgi:hypothetical protein